MKSIVITGTSSGFGWLSAVELARAGHRVFAGMRHVAAENAKNAPAARSLRTATRECPWPVEVVDLDVTDDSSVMRAMEQVHARAGQVDVLVNNAGLAAAGLVETFTPEDARRIFEVNVVGALRMARAVLPGMRARRDGLLLAVSSVLGRQVLPFLGVYEASKFALEALWEALSYEVASQGVDVCLAEPGTFPTTGILDNMHSAGDAGRALEYGAVQGSFQQFLGGLRSFAASGVAPSPELVAQEIRALIDAKPGQRPRRRVVDPQGRGGTERINDVSDEVQRQLLEGLGLGSLLSSHKTSGG